MKIFHVIFACVIAFPCSGQIKKSDLQSHELKGKVREATISKSRVDSLKMQNNEAKELKFNMQTVQFDEKGNLTALISGDTNTITSKLSYNDKNDLISIKRYSNKKGLTSQTNFTYKETKNKKEIFQEDTALKFKFHEEYIYSDNGKKVTQTKFGSDTIKIISIYDSKKLLIKQESFSGNELLVTRTYTYDQASNLVTYKKEEENQTTTTVHSYKNGKKRTTVVNTKYHPSKEIIDMKYEDSQGKIETTVYDVNENPFEVTTKYPEGGFFKIKYSYVYDDRQNWTKRVMIEESDARHRTEITERKITYYE